MSKKSAKIAALIEDCRGKGWDPHYLGFFECFNRQLFFEAHDVLEELWLAGGRTAPNYGFHKGLIQLAGAFVHLQKDRLRPAVSLFNLAEQHLTAYPAHHDGCDLGAILRLIADWRGRVEAGDWQLNPLPGAEPPRLALPVPP